MKDYYYSKKLKTIIPFDKILLVHETEYSEETIVSVATSVFVKLEKEEGKEFREAYIEWLEKDNISQQYPF